MVSSKSNGMYTFSAAASGPCFGGACTIEWLPQTILTDAKADKIATAIKDSPEFKDSAGNLEPGAKGSILDEWAVMLSCWFSVKGDRGQSPYLDAFLSWAGSLDLSTVEPGYLWAARISMPYVIVKEIRNSWRKAQEPINPPQKLPGTALTAEQIEALADKNSPLVYPAGNGDKDNAN